MLHTTIEDVEANVEAETTESGAIGALIKGIETLLADALYSEPISPAGNGRVRRIFESLKARNDALTAAALANTPSAPREEPEPDTAALVPEPPEQHAEVISG